MGCISQKHRKPPVVSTINLAYDAFKNRTHGLFLSQSLNVHQ